MRATRYRLACRVLACLAPVAVSVSAFAGPPFLTDDPDPVPYHHWELYNFESSDRTGEGLTVDGPALELNNGVAPNTQLHLIVPETFVDQNGSNAQGLGDIEFGVKYRFATETRSRPEIGVFPLVELPTGDRSQGLGNGVAWYKAPVWLEKNWGPWQSYGGGGYAHNPAFGMRDYWFGGLLVQRKLSDRLSLGGEVYAQGAQNADSGMPGGRSSELYNIGGIYNFTPDFSLLFTAGHSFEGEGNTVTYLGLYRTWGPGAP